MGASGQGIQGWAEGDSDDGGEGGQGPAGADESQRDRAALEQPRAGAHTASSQALALLRRGRPRKVLAESGGDQRPPG